MPSLTHIWTVALKELRELLHRPWQALTLIFGPLAIMIAFGIGSDATANPPRAIIVLPPGQPSRDSCATTSASSTSSST